MAIRIKYQLRGKDGGKHPHQKNTQDFDVQVTPHPQLCRINANIAYNNLRGHVGQLDDIADGMARLLLDDVLDSLERLIDVLPKGKP